MNPEMRAIWTASLLCVCVRVSSLGIIDPLCQQFGDTSLTTVTARRERGQDVSIIAGESLIDWFCLFSAQVSNISPVVTKSANFLHVQL